MSSVPPASKSCPQCGNVSALDAMGCIRCGFVFPSPAGHFQAPPAYQNFVPPINTAPDSTKMLVTLLLWFFVGSLGTHRLYLGHVNTGIAMLALSVAGYLTLCIVV